MLGFCQDMYDNLLTVKAATKKKDPEKVLLKKKSKITTDNITLKAMYHDQEKRRKDGWTPAGGRAGTCAVPPYNKSHNDCTISVETNYKINDKRAAVTIFNKALQHHDSPKIS